MSLPVQSHTSGSGQLRGSSGRAISGILGKRIGNADEEGANETLLVQRGTLVNSRRRCFAGFP
jgi:hypothetical protein